MAALAYVLCLLVAVAVTSATFAQVSSHHSDSVSCSTVHGKLLKLVKPAYPTRAAQKGIGGTVNLDVKVNRKGEPTTVRVLRGDPTLAEAAAVAVRQWRWQPVTLNGQAVAMETTVTVKFEPKTRGRQ